MTYTWQAHAAHQALAAAGRLATRDLPGGLASPSLVTFQDGSELFWGPSGPWDWQVRQEFVDEAREKGLTLDEPGDAPTLAQGASPGKSDP